MGLDIRADDLKEIVRICVDSELQTLYIEAGGVRMALSKSDAALPLLGAMARGEALPPAPGGAAAQVPGEAPGEPGRGGEATAPVDPQPDGATAGAIAGPMAATAGREGLVDVKAPSLGVFYRRPAPDQPPFVEAGGEVGQGDTVCLLEVMKTYTRVAAPCAGRVAEICVEDGAMVEYGQTLMRVEPR